MKTIRFVTAILVLASGTALLSITSGCAASGTSRSTGEYIDDASITTKVKTSLLRDPVVSGFDVGIDTYRGHVQLNGFVDTQEQRIRAEQIAQTIPGVVSVGNRLAVKGQVAQPPPGAMTQQQPMQQQYGSPTPTGNVNQNQWVDPTVQSAARSIRQGWDANPELARLNLQVSPENGRLVIRGTVPNTELWNRAKETAEGLVRGVPIDNQITVSAPPR